MTRRIPLLLLIDQTVTDNAPIYAATMAEDVRHGRTTYLDEWARVLPPERMPQTEAAAEARFWYRAGLASARALAISYAWQQAERRKLGPNAETMFDVRVQKAIDFASAAATYLSNVRDTDRADIIVRRTLMAKSDGRTALRYRRIMLGKVGQAPKGLALTS